MSECDQCQPCGCKPYRTSELYEGRYYPIIQVHNLAVPAGTEVPLSSVSPVRRNLVVSVTSGVVYIWFVAGASGRAYVGGEGPHLTVGIGPLPFVLPLPPGLVNIIVGAGGSLDLDAAIMFVDVEER